MNAEVVWHGALWRSFPEPQVGAPVGGVVIPGGIPRTRLSERQIQALAELETHGDRTLRDLYRVCGVSPKTMRTDLAGLIERGYVEAIAVPNVNRGGWGWVYRRGQA